MAGADAHGEQRARLGWSADELHREYVILHEEIEALARRELPADGDEDPDAALALVRRLLEQAERVSLDSLQDSAPAP